MAQSERPIHANIRSINRLYVPTRSFRNKNRCATPQFHVDRMCICRLLKRQGVSHRALIFACRSFSSLSLNLSFSSFSQMAAIWYFSHSGIFPLKGIIQIQAMSKYLLLSLLLLQLTSAFDGGCVWKDSKVANDYLPCNSTSAGGTCCLKGETCLDSGLCQSAARNIYRVSLFFWTSPTFIVQFNCVCVMPMYRRVYCTYVYTY